MLDNLLPDLLLQICAYLDYSTEGSLIPQLSLSFRKRYSLDTVRKRSLVHSLELRNIKTRCKRMEHYQNDQLRVVLDYWGPTKIWYETHYLNGKRHGPERIWFEDGGPLGLETIYSEGQKHGLQRMWLANGQLQQEDNYQKGNLHGLSRTWRKDQVWVEKNYLTGVLISHTQRRWSIRKKGYVLQNRLYKIVLNGLN